MTPAPLDELRIDRWRHAVVAPWAKDAAGVERAGVLVEGAARRESLLYWGKRLRVRAPVLDPSADLEISGETAIYAGHLMRHFGHFLLDSLARLWACRARPDLPIVWVGGDGYEPWQRTILDMLGIANRPIFLDRPTRFEELLVPEPGFVIDTSFHPDHERFLGCVEPSEPMVGRKGWISRSKLPLARGGIANEAEIEAAAAAQGWTIFHPQDHGVRKQLDFLSSCETIGGFRGSGFHSIVLLRSLAASLHVFARSDSPQVTFDLIADRKRLKQVMHPVEMEIVSGRWPKVVARPIDSAALIETIDGLS